MIDDFFLVLIILILVWAIFYVARFVWRSPGILIFAVLIYLIIDLMPTMDAVGNFDRITIGDQECIRFYPFQGESAYDWSCYPKSLTEP